MVLLALDFLYYSAINYELCRVYLEKWGLGGRWLKKARSQWNRSLVEESEAQAQTHPMVPSHYQPRHSLRGESHSPTLLPYNTSTAWWVVSHDRPQNRRAEESQITVPRGTSQSSRSMCLRWDSNSVRKKQQVANLHRRNRLLDWPLLMVNMDPVWTEGGII